MWWYLHTVKLLPSPEGSTQAVCVMYADLLIKFLGYLSAMYMVFILTLSLTSVTNVTSKRLITLLCLNIIENLTMNKCDQCKFATLSIALLREHM